MIEYIPQLAESGLDCLKIEGRMKSSGYAATVTNAYRVAVDSYFEDPQGYVFDKRLLDEVEGVCHREYSTGFFFGDQIMNANVCEKSGYIKEQAMLAVAVSDSASDGTALFYQKNKLEKGDALELLSPGKTGKAFFADGLFDEDGQSIDSTPHPMMKFRLRVPFPVHEGDILRAGNARIDEAL